MKRLLFVTSLLLLGAGCRGPWVGVYLPADGRTIVQEGFTSQSDCTQYEQGKLKVGDKFLCGVNCHYSQSNSLQCERVFDNNNHIY